MKAIYKNAICAVITIFIVFGCLTLIQHGYERQRDVVRNAVMVDTSASMSEVKSHVYYNTYGYFRDSETNDFFRASINDSLYREFARDGKHIPVSWAYSIDDREQTSKGLFYIIFGVIFAGLSCVLCFVYVNGEK